MSFTFKDYEESANYIRSQIGDFVPQVLLILGSGLGFLGDIVEEPIYVDYGTIPHFHVSTAPGHKGRFVFGKLNGKNVAVMQGRMHCYEGYTMEEVSFPVRVLKLLGATSLIVTNAAGAINEQFKAGDLMLITDHIRIFGFGPLNGTNIPEFGVRFPDMSTVYDPALQEVARQISKKLNIPLKEGVYMYFPGPQYETPAEIRAARAMGADACGMSTVPEATVANHCGMKILGVTLCANMAAGILKQPLTEQEVIDMAEVSKEKFSKLILGCLEEM